MKSNEKRVLNRAPILNKFTEDDFKNKPKLNGAALGPSLVLLGRFMEVLGESANTFELYPEEGKIVFGGGREFNVVPLGHRRLVDGNWVWANSQQFPGSGKMGFSCDSRNLVEEMRRTGSSAGIEEMKNNVIHCDVQFLEEHILSAMALAMHDGSLIYHLVPFGSGLDTGEASVALTNPPAEIFEWPLHSSELTEAVAETAKFGNIDQHALTESILEWGGIPYKTFDSGDILARFGSDAQSMGREDLYITFAGHPEYAAQVKQIRSLPVSPAAA